MKAEQLLEYLRARCFIDACGCWIWRGAVSTNGRPTFHLRGVDTHGRNARAAAYFWGGGERLAGRVFARPTCDELCVNPAHQVYVTRRQAMRRAAADGRLSSGKRHAAAVSAVRRKQRKVRDEIIAAMRARYAETGNAAVVAREFGVHHSYAHRVCTYRVRREGNAFVI